MSSEKVKPAKRMSDWEVVLNVMCPKIKRPRRTSLHTLATVCGREDPLALAKEMQDSGKVLGYVCPDVRTPIFYLESLCRHPGMIDTRDAKIWEKLPDFFAKNPYPQVKGFKRFAQDTWTGGSYGKGKQIKATSAMEVPYEKDDFQYAKAVIDALREAGYTPGIEEPVLPPPTTQERAEALIAKFKGKKAKGKGRKSGQDFDGVIEGWQQMKDGEIVVTLTASMKCSLDSIALAGSAPDLVQITAEAK